jgi:hypothetical protein
MSERIENEIAKLVPEGIGHVNYEGVRYRALPLMGTIGVVWLLRSDGTFWKVDSDLGVPFEPLPENLHITALVYGTERYPWLASLLPSRPVDSVACAHCRGTGRLGADGAFFCPDCDALGWCVAKRT